MLIKCELEIEDNCCIFAVQNCPCGLCPFSVDVTCLQSNNDTSSFTRNCCAEAKRIRDTCEDTKFANLSKVGSPFETLDLVYVQINFMGYKINVSAST